MSDPIHPPPPTEDHDSQSDSIPTSIPETALTSDAPLTSHIHTDHPSQTPPGTASESGSGASTPSTKRRRRESVAGRRESIARRRESVGARRESLAGTVIVIRLRCHTYVV